MGLVIYPRQPREPRPAPIDPTAGSDPSPRSRANNSPERILVGLIAGAALFYLLGKAMGLGRDPNED